MTHWQLNETSPRIYDECWFQVSKKYGMPYIFCKVYMTSSDSYELYHTYVTLNQLGPFTNIV